MTVDELNQEIEQVAEYLAYLLLKLELAQSIEKGRQASAELLTEKLIERIKHD